jgi:hypothetical protein
VDRTAFVQLVRAFEAEVNNGGFDQFFFNSLSGQTPQIITALEAIGAAQTADILKRAAEKFPGGMPPLEWTARQNMLLDTVSPEADAFEQLDQEFYQRSENLTALLANFETP